jgi:outer membrane protein assembly factor BamB
VLVTLASLAAAIALVRGGALEPLVGGVVDQAVRNIITLILAFSGLVSLLAWFVWQSGHSRRVKRAVGWGALGLVALACAVFRVERVSGDLVPEIMFRWSPSRDRLLPRDAAAPAAAGAAPWAATPADFPRFLGPDGACGVDGPAIDPDWAARPPRLLWRRPIGAGWSAFAVCGDHAVTLEQRGDEEIVSCLSAATGNPEWSVTVAARHQTVLGGIGPRSTPTIRDGIVYATGATGWLHAVDGATGRVLWRKNVVDDLGIDAAAHAAAVSWGRAGSPLVTDTLVIVPGGGPTADGGAVSLAAYDRATGAPAWKGGDQQISYVTPDLVSFAGREVVMAVNESSVAGYDPADGRELWRFDWPGHSNSDATCSQAHVLDERRILITKGYGIGAAVFEMQPGEMQPGAPPTFTRVWSQPGALKTKFTNVAVHDGHAYGLSDGILECVSVADGSRRWKGGRYGQGQVLRVGGLIVVQAESGEVVLVECTPEKHVVRARLAAIDGQTWNTVCLSGSRLLVRNAQEAACYDVPLAERDAAP